MAARGAEGIATPSQAVTVPARRRDHSAVITFWLFVAPMVIGLVLFTFLPIGWGFLLSLSRARSSIDLGAWVGLQNYVDIVRDPNVRTIIERGLLWAAR